MSQPDQQPEKQGKFEPLTADQLKPEHMEEALATARRYDRNFANKEGTDAIPVPARTCRLLGLALINLHNSVNGAAAKPSTEKGYFASTAAPKAPAAKKTAKAPAKKAGASAAQKKPAPRTVKKKAVEAGPALTAEQKKAFETVSGILADKLVVTTRLVAERGGWASHNTGARHIKSLVDLGYLKRVGKQQVLALTGIQP